MDNEVIKYCLAYSSFAGTCSNVEMPYAELDFLRQETVDIANPI